MRLPSARDLVVVVVLVVELVVQIVLARFGASSLVAPTPRCASAALSSVALCLGGGLVGRRPRASASGAAASAVSACVAASSALGLAGRRGGAESSFVSTRPPVSDSNCAQTPETVSSFCTCSVGCAPLRSHASALSPSMSTTDGSWRGRVLADDLDEAAVAGRARVGDDDAVASAASSCPPHQADLDGHERGVPLGADRGASATPARSRAASDRPAERQPGLRRSAQVQALGTGSLRHLALGRR